MTVLLNQVDARGKRLLHLMPVCDGSVISWFVTTEIKQGGDFTEEKEKSGFTEPRRECCERLGRCLNASHQIKFTVQDEPQGPSSQTKRERLKFCCPRIINLVSYFILLT